MTSSEYQREWRRKNPEKVREYAQRHRENHRESNNLAQRKWRATHAEEHRESKRQWRRDNTAKRNVQRKKNYDQTLYAFKSHDRWDQAHEILVLEHACSDRELHELIGRSVRAIQVRRAGLKNGVVPTGGIPEHLLA